MVISLLELDGGGIALEFEEVDFDALRAAITSRFGVIRMLEQAALYSDVEFGGERFLYYHEWTPCLISRSETGKNMLRQIAAHSQRDTDPCDGYRSTP